MIQWVDNTRRRFALSNRLGLLAACVVGGLMSVVAVMAFDRRPVMEYTDWSITPRDVKPGGWVVATYVATRYRDCPGWVRRTITFADGEVFNYDPTPSSVGRQINYPDAASPRPDFPIKGARIRRVVQIPPDPETGAKWARGTFEYTSQLCYHCNPLQSQFPSMCLPLRAPSFKLNLVDP